MITFKQFLEEGREVIGGTEYFVNPSAVQVLALTKRFSYGARWLYSKEFDEFVIWDANKRDHFFASKAIWGETEMNVKRHGEKYYSGFTGINEADGIESQFLIDDKGYSESEKKNAERILDKYISKFDYFDWDV